MSFILKLYIFFEENDQGSCPFNRVAVGMRICGNSHGNDFKHMGIPTCGNLWDSAGIPTEILWEWELKFHPHGNPAFQPWLIS